MASFCRPHTLRPLLPETDDPHAAAGRGLGIGEMLGRYFVCDQCDRVGRRDQVGVITWVSEIEAAQLRGAAEDFAARESAAVAGV
jgi:hypothetical protein